MTSATGRSVSGVVSDPSGTKRRHRFRLTPVWDLSVCHDPSGTHRPTLRLDASTLRPLDVVQDGARTTRETRPATTTRKDQPCPITPTRIRANDDLHDQLDRLHVWIDHVPAEHRVHVSARLDQLARLLGELVAGTDDDGPDAA